MRDPIGLADLDFRSIAAGSAPILCKKMILAPFPASVNLCCTKNRAFVNNFKLDGSPRKP
jgi:hypothetical protein